MWQRDLQLLLCFVCGLVVRGEDTTTAQLMPSPTDSANSISRSSAISHFSGQNHTYNGTLTLNQAWNEKLLNNTSDEYKNISGAIEERLRLVFQNETGFVAVKVDKLLNGSIIAEFSLVMKASLTVTSNSLTLKLEAAFKGFFLLLFFEIRAEITINIHFGSSKALSVTSSTSAVSSLTSFKAQPTSIQVVFLSSSLDILPSLHVTASPSLLSSSSATIQGTITAISAQSSPQATPSMSHSQDIATTHSTPTSSYTSPQVTTSLPGMETTPSTQYPLRLPTSHLLMLTTSTSSFSRITMSLTRSEMTTYAESSSVSISSSSQVIQGKPNKTALANSTVLLPESSPRPLPTSSSHVMTTSRHESSSSLRSLMPSLSYPSTAKVLPNLQSQTPLISPTQSSFLTETAPGSQTTTWLASPLPINLTTISQPVSKSIPSSLRTTMNLQRTTASLSVSRSLQKTLSISLSSSHLTSPISAIYSNVSSQGLVLHTKTMSTILATTTAYPTIKNPKVFGCKLTLNRPWNDDLNNSTSSEYVRLAGFVEGNLTKVLNKEPGFVSVTVDRFFQGSVGVDLTVVLNATSNSTSKSLEESILKANSSGNLALPVSGLSIQFKEISSTAYSSYVVNSTFVHLATSTSPVLLTDSSSQLRTPSSETSMSPRPPILTQSVSLSSLSMSSSQVLSSPLSVSLSNFTLTSSALAVSPSTSLSNTSVLAVSPSTSLSNISVLAVSSSTSFSSISVLAVSPSPSLSNMSVLAVSPSPSLSNMSLTSSSVVAVSPSTSLSNMSLTSSSVVAVSPSTSLSNMSLTSSSVLAVSPSPSLSNMSLTSSSVVAVSPSTSLSNMSLTSSSVVAVSQSVPSSNMSLTSSSVVAVSPSVPSSNMSLTSSSVVAVSPSVPSSVFSSSPSVPSSVFSSSPSVPSSVFSSSPSVPSSVLSSSPSVPSSVLSSSPSVPSSVLSSSPSVPSSVLSSSPSVPSSVLSSSPSVPSSVLSSSPTVPSSVLSSSPSVPSSVLSSSPSVPSSVLSSSLSVPSSVLSSSPSVPSSVLSSSPSVPSSVLSSSPSVPSSVLSSSPSVPSSVSLSSPSTPVPSPSLSSSSILTTPLVITTPKPVVTKTRTFKCIFKIIRAWTSNLLYSYCQEFKDLVREVTEKITKVLRKSLEFLSVVILRFFEGSIGVEMNVIFAASSNVTDALIEESIKSANSSGTLGLNLVELSVEEDKPTTGGDEGLETWVIVVIIASIVVFVLLIIIIVLAVCIKRLSKKKKRYSLWIDDSVVYSRRHTYVSSGNGEMVELRNYPRNKEWRNERTNDDEQGNLRESYENAGQNSEELI